MRFPAFVLSATLSKPPPPPTIPATSKRTASPIIFSNEVRPLPVPAPVLQLLPPFELRDIAIEKPKPSQRLPSLPSPFNLLGPLSTALQTLAHYHFALNPETEELKGRVALFRGTPCPKWHMDRVRMRGMVTLAGPGSLVFEQDDDTDGRVRECKTGDVLLMSGAGRKGDRDGLWHRSPDWDGVRVVVQTDDVDEFS
eukprot:GFKZ01013572.1.p1 GENE.GFKZ01013572.1~~GFKZ01013572.1.p1  ORF type:complete len:197 (-),score=20.95 GFKZ01013572.1:1042-1632(-)